jgi:hypothetical protein
MRRILQDKFCIPTVAKSSMLKRVKGFGFQGQSVSSANLLFQSCVVSRKAEVFVQASWGVTLASWLIIFLRKQPRAGRTKR